MDFELTTDTNIPGLRETASDDLAAFDQVVRAWTPRLSALAHRLLAWSAGPYEVEDVVQDVFLAAWKHLPEFRGEAGIGTWLTRITINQCRQHRRRKMVRLNWLCRAEHEAPPAAGDTVEQAIHHDETVVQLRAAVAALPHKYREVIVLHYLEQHDVNVTADLLGLRKNTVEVRLHRARRLLKTRLDGEMEI